MGRIVSFSMEHNPCQRYVCENLRTADQMVDLECIRNYSTILEKLLSMYYASDELDS